MDKDAMARAAQNGQSKEARECAEWIKQQVKDHPTVQNRIEQGDASANYGMVEVMRQAVERSLHPLKKAGPKEHGGTKRTKEIPSKNGSYTGVTIERNWPGRTT